MFWFTFQIGNVSDGFYYYPSKLWVLRDTIVRFGSELWILVGISERRCWKGKECAVAGRGGRVAGFTLNVKVGYVCRLRHGLKFNLWLRLRKTALILQWRSDIGTMNTGCINWLAVVYNPLSFLQYSNCFFTKCRRCGNNVPWSSSDTGWKSLTSSPSQYTVIKKSLKFLSLKRKGNW